MPQSRPVEIIICGVLLSSSSSFFWDVCGDAVVVVAAAAAVVVRGSSRRTCCRFSGFHRLFGINTSLPGGRKIHDGRCAEEKSTRTGSTSNPVVFTTTCSSGFFFLGIDISFDGRPG